MFAEAFAAFPYWLDRFCEGAFFAVLVDIGAYPILCAREVTNAVSHGESCVLGQDF